ncbi:MAG: hypothetical protein ACK5AZ_10750 [Bryobacteraceae bacterium]
MSRNVLQQIRSAISTLNPNEVREIAERPVSVGLAASGSAGYAAMEDFFSPGSLSADKRWTSVQILHRTSDASPGEQYDLLIYEQGMQPPPNGGQRKAFPFYYARPERTVQEILEAREDLGLPLARHFTPFRQAVAARVVTTVAKENALFSLATALPNLIPGFSVPWAAGEFASDTTVLTVNQIRMAFLLAGASDRDIGFREQKAEIGGIIAGAFGWRSLARNLVGKLPLGGGIIPKGAIAYAGTWVIGQSIERVYRIGYGMTRQERRAAYEEAFERGKGVASALLENLRRRAAEG